MKRSQFKAGFILTIAILLITFSFYGYQIFFTQNFLIKDETAKEAYLYIPTNASFKQVVDSLQKNKIVHDHVYFGLVSKLMKYQENIKPGRYKIKKGDNNIDVVRKLRAGDQDPLNITFNNIRTKEDLAERLSLKLEVKHEDLLNKLYDTATAKKYGLDTATIMTMFIPNTYEFFWTASVDEVFERMHREHKNFWTEERLKKAEKLNLTPVQVTILASIVEAETNKDSEKATIAGVYLNRLNKGWLLQADPTVKYAVNDWAIRRVTFEHTKTDSPYNTYKYTGLPPGPITLPSIVSIDAVLNHEEHKYMFFVASPVNPGYHTFSETFSQHVKSAKQYHKHLNARKIK